jgi:hypothetical protein
MFNFFKNKVIDETIEEQKQDLMPFSEEDRKEFLDGENCDVVTCAVGEFGRSATNPIPVNGPAGEIKYLNRMKIEDGPSIIYHRIGSVTPSNLNRPVDVFEVVSVGGKHWDILYLDMYHPRRSVKAPKGYVFSKFHKIFSRLPVGYGSTNRDITFPFGIGDLIEQNRSLEAYVSPERLAMRYRELVANKDEYIRPVEHEERLKMVIQTLNNTSYFQMDVKFP